MHRHKFSLFAVAIVLLFAAVATGQITITSSSFPAVGTSFMTYNAGPVAVNVGSGGASQTWDFSAMDFYEDMVFQFINPSYTPFVGNFSNPTHSYGVTVDGAAGYAYWRVESGAVYDLGYGAEVQGIPVIIVRNPAPAVVTFPLSYQTQWTSVSRYTYATMSYTDSSLNVADGWGTLMTPEETWSVLRVKRHIYTITRLGPLPPQTVESWQYDFLTEDGFTGGTVSGADGSEGPNFSEAYIDAMVAGVAAVEPARGPLAERASVNQNYPNPFNPFTAIPLWLTKSARVELKVYDESGRLISGQTFDLPVGANTLRVDGSSWSSGTYFANVNVNGESQTVKMQLVK